ncbi:MAG: sensor histidine kinase [Synergistaceae bacterium]|jgi:two-component system sensor histidine kinase DegS|nr:sensor histidine kinase [Synergistaceae bacterium]
MVDDCYKSKLQSIIDKTNEFLGYTIDHVVGIRDDVLVGLRDLSDELNDVRKEVGEVLSANDAVTGAYRNARSQLAEGEADMDYEAQVKIYGEAERLMRLRSSFEERERYLRRRRDDLEREKVRMERIMGNSTQVMGKLRLAEDILKNRMDNSNQVMPAEDSQTVSLALQFAERENKRLAREIHDGPIQQFAATVLSFEYLEKIIATGDRDAISAEVKRVKAQIREGLGDFRGFLLQLQPVGLEKGLGKAIMRLAESYIDRHGVKFEVKTSQEEDNFSSVLRSNVFRIVQEAASNALRHGGATKITVKYAYTENELSLVIEDNGKGFEVDKGRAQATERGSFGLSNMSERIGFVKGSINIDSKVGRGTRISIKVPVGGG